MAPFSRITAIAAVSETKQTSSTAVVSSAGGEGVVANFRPAAGLSRVYRCGAPDRLGELILPKVREKSEPQVAAEASSTGDALDVDERYTSEKPETTTEEEADDGFDRALTDGERFLLYDATLVIDLRRAAERRDESHRAWVRGAPGGPFDVLKPPDDYKGDHQDDFPVDNDRPRGRTILCVDLVGGNRGRASGSSDDGDVDSSVSEKEAERQQLRKLIELVNEKGMIVLLEKMLLDSKDRFFQALRAVTVHLEVRPDDGTAVVHCTQGKDRTGLVIMLLQLAVGVPDDVIIADFAASSAAGTSEAARQAVQRLGIPSQIDGAVLASADPRIMEDALGLLRDRYGSVMSYLDEIGFDETWRQRLKATQVERRQLTSCTNQE